MFQDSRFARYALRITFYVLFLLAAFLAIAWSPEPQTDSVAITGQVTNGTPGGAVPENLPVTLSVFTGMSETSVYTTTVAADGTFVFDELSLEGGETLLARATYRDLTYTSDFASFEAGQQEISLPVTIYETTDDAEGVSILQLHVFLQPADGNLFVKEYCWYGNSGGEAYTGRVDAETGERTTVAFTLPAASKNLSFEGSAASARFVETEQGFADTRPVLPAEEPSEDPNLLFSYDLSYQDGVQVEQAFDVPVRRVVLVLPGEDLRLRGKGLTPQETEMGAALYVAGPLAADEPLAFSVVPTRAGQGGRGSGGLAIGLAALAAAAVAVYLIWRSPAAGAVPAQVRPQVEAIAALDADFEAGQISEKAYRKKRRSLKSEVRERLAHSSND